VKVFFALIFITTVLRAVYFLTPLAGFGTVYPGEAWPTRSFLAGLSVLEAGTLSFFTIFILVVVSWADILQKAVQDVTQPKNPLFTCFQVSCFLGAIQALNVFFTGADWYGQGGAIDASAVIYVGAGCMCLIEFSIFSYRFRKALQALGDINQVSTEKQINRILMMTISSNTFFFIRVVLEATVGLVIFMDLKVGRSFESSISRVKWDTYVIFAYGLEIFVLFVLLNIFRVGPASKGLSQARSCVSSAFSLAGRRQNDPAYGTL